MPPSSGTRSELTLPSDEDYLPIAEAFARELATLAGFPPREVDALMTGVEDACADIISFAFDANDPGTMTLVGEVSPTTLTLSIIERGLPLGASADGDGVRLHHGAPGWKLIDHAVDQAHWINRGREGSELRVVIDRPDLDVTQHLPESELTPLKEDVPLAPDQEYTIRRLLPEDAVQVAQCVYRAYGYTYGNEDLYYPGRIAHLNEAGRLISVVVAAEDGSVVGHLALERPDLGPIAESGQAVVIPAHRGRHLLERMRDFAEDEGRREGLLAIFSEPVTSHPYSQRVNEKVGSHACGVRLGAMPRSTSFKSITSEALPQRESCMIYTQYLVAPPTAVVHVPAHHREVLERVYTHLEAPADFREPGVGDAGSVVSVSFDRAWQYGLVRVEAIGETTSTEVQRALRDLVDTSGAEVVYLELPLALAATPTLCVEAEEMGFFFSGISPLFAKQGDILRLQYLNCELDTSRLAIASPFGQELVDYVARERQRVSSS